MPQVAALWLLLSCDTPNFVYASYESKNDDMIIESKSSSVDSSTSKLMPPCISNHGTQTSKSHHLPHARLVDPQADWLVHDSATMDLVILQTIRSRGAEHAMRSFHVPGADTPKTIHARIGARMHSGVT